MTQVIRKWTIRCNSWDNPRGEWRIKDSDGPGFRDNGVYVPKIEVIALDDLRPLVDRLKMEMMANSNVNIILFNRIKDLIGALESEGGKGNG